MHGWTTVGSKALVIDDADVNIAVESHARHSRVHGLPSHSGVAAVVEPVAYLFEPQRARERNPVAAEGIAVVETEKGG